MSENIVLLERYTMKKQYIFHMEQIEKKIEETYHKGD